MNPVKTVLKVMGPSVAWAVGTVALLGWGEISRLQAGIITFASVAQKVSSANDFRYTNKGDTSATFNTSGSIAVTLTVDRAIALASGLPVPSNPNLPVVFNAHLKLTSKTTSAVTAQGTLLAEHFPSATNKFVITLDKAINGKRDFLTATYSDLLSGVSGSDQVSLQASDALKADTVVFKSDFIDFSRTIEHGLSFTFSSVTSKDGGGLELPAGASFFNSFSASGVGSFDMNIIPEPASLTLAGIGTLAVAGIGLYRRRKRSPGIA
jgi:PEP-CTERM motif